ncbi:MAG TPA: hypothetical protein PKD45_08995 [Flavobacteriales bacterium]|nr:hypothetical protein [Flavobacteriales bacterium]
MPTRNPLFLLPALLMGVLTGTCRAQTDAGTWHAALSSPSFVLEEVYTGDWGDHVLTLTFTQQGDGHHVTWSVPRPGHGEQSRHVFLTTKELRELEALFTNCSAKIDSLANTSTEHVLYRFTAAGHTHVIDDRYSMACHGAFRAWREELHRRAGIR